MVCTRQAGATSQIAHIQKLGTLRDSFHFEWRDRSTAFGRPFPQGRQTDVVSALRELTLADTQSQRRLHRQ